MKYDDVVDDDDLYQLKWDDDDWCYENEWDEFYKRGI